MNTAPRPLGSAPVVVGPLGLGCWPLAGMTRAGVTREAAVATVRAAVDAGIVHLDTAYCYGEQGEADRAIGEALGWSGSARLSRVPHDAVVTAGKCGIHWEPDSSRDPPRRQVVDGRPERLRAEVERFVGVLGEAAGNPYVGKRLFREHCGKCHVLFSEGGEIGPNLTSYQRDDLRRMLLNVVHPSLEIREGYENVVVITGDGRSVNGFVADQDNQVVVLKGADGRLVVIPRDEIDEMQALPRSIMPEKLLDPLDDQQVRDLFAYLRATQPLATR